jgi:hypothetical protein
MILRIHEPFEIDNPQNYPAGIVDELRKLLMSGVSAQADPKRERFYDIESDDRVFFICVFSMSNTVTLLATWLKHLATSVPASYVQGSREPN